MLRRAEQASEDEARYQPTSGATAYPETHDPSCQDGGFAATPNRTNGPDSQWPPVYGPPVPQNPTLSSDDHKSEEANPSSDDEDSAKASSTTITSDDDDSNSRKAAYEGDDTATPARGILQPGSTISRSSPYVIASPRATHQQSNLLHSIIPYRPLIGHSVGSDRLILAGQNLSRNSTAVSQTESVRKLLDKWTTSGSAVVSTLLDEEAANEKSEA